jgi:MSHA pilin protein MshD
MSNKGFTLIELIVAIVIIGIGIAGFAQLMNTSATNSIDPMVRQQANAVARAYLEEILLKSFCDPDLTSDCPGVCTGGNTCSDTTNCTENTGGAETRATFDDVCDYELPEINNASVEDQTGSPLSPELDDYRVTVDIIDNSAADINLVDGDSSQIMRVDVNVTHIGNTNVDVTLSGYKTNF